MDKPAKSKAGNPRGWKRNPSEVRRDILRVASEVFANHGLSGARIDDIAAQTRTSKRMIYYYFGDKKSLYDQVLEAAYSKVRQGEERLDLDGLHPERALAELVRFTFDHHWKNPKFIRMVMIENVHNAEHLKKMPRLREVNRAAIARLSDVVDRGVEHGIFRQDIDPVRLHWQISAMCFFNVANRWTFSTLFGGELFTRDGQDALREDVVRAILGMTRP